MSTTAPNRRRRATFLAASFFIVTGAGLTACGDGDDTADSSSTTESTTSTTAAPSEAVEQIAESIRTDFGEDLVTEDEASCFAQTLVDDVGEDKALELKDDESLPTELPESDQAALERAIDECIPATAFATAFASEFYSGLGTDAEPTPEVAACVSKEFGDSTWALLVASSSGDEDSVPPELMSALDSCVPTEVVAAALAASFEAEGATPAEATCTADAVASQVTLSELAELEGAAEPSPELMDRIGQAAMNCTGTAG